MKLRPLLSVVAGTGLALLVQATAHAGTPSSITDDSGDAPKTIDITKVRYQRTPADYRATISFTDLKPTAATRRIVSFSTTDGSTRPGSRSITGTSWRSQAIDLRVSPSGVVSVKSWKSSSNNSTPRPVACSGIAATPNYNTNKVYVVIPEACWYPDTPQVDTSSYALKYTDTSAYDGSTLPVIFRTKPAYDVDYTAILTWSADGPF